MKFKSSFIFWPMDVQWLQHHVLKGDGSSLNCFCMSTSKHKQYHTKVVAQQFAFFTLSYLEDFFMSIHTDLVLHSNCCGSSLTLGSWTNLTIRLKGGELAWEKDASLSSLTSN